MFLKEFLKERMFIKYEELGLILFNGSHIIMPSVKAWLFLVELRAIRSGVAQSV
jgi:hypothetical protein